MVRGEKSSSFFYCMKAMVSKYFFNAMENDNAMDIELLHKTLSHMSEKGMYVLS